MLAYQLCEPMVAVSHYGLEKQKKIIMLPKGAVITLARLPQHGLIEVRWDDETVSVFAEDLESHGIKAKL